MIVALDLGRSEHLVIAILAVIKSGSAYLLLDFELSLAKMQSLLKESEARLLITRHGLHKDFSIPTVVIDSQDIGNELDENLSLQEDIDALLYLVYTSGSTGYPKSVKIMRKSVDNLLISLEKRWNITQRDCWLSTTSLVFDIFNLEILLPGRLLY